MKIAVVSDTHGDISFFLEAMKNIKGVEKILHLGDYDIDGYNIEKKTGIITYIVAGNNDIGSREVQDKVLNIEGHKILMTHGHKYNVYFGIDRLVYRAEEIGVDLVLYGHTHYFMDEHVGPIRVINPGSASLPRGNDQASFVILEITQADIIVNRIIK